MGIDNDFIDFTKRKYCVSCGEKINSKHEAQCIVTKASIQVKKLKKLKRVLSIERKIENILKYRLNKL